MGFNPLKKRDKEKPNAFLIKSYHSAERNEVIDEFEAQYVPDSYTKQLSHVYIGATDAPINVSSPSLKYSHSHATQLTFQLIVDASEEDDDILGALAGKLLPFSDKEETEEGVKEQIELFLTVCYLYDGEIHEPRFLEIEWSNFSLPCRLQSVSIQYTMFNKDGTPIRAKLDTVFIGDVSKEIRKKSENRQSADISRVHIIKQGDSLPLITQKYYLKASYYLLLAKYNNLNHFCDLQPGMELEIPTLKNLTEKT